MKGKTLKREFSLPVSETFYSLQGEGPTMGVPAVFLRLGGCNLMCGGRGTEKDGKLRNGATWRCDTIEVWLKWQRKEFKDILSPGFVSALKNGAHLVITGGEPVLHQNAIMNYLTWFKNMKGFIPYVEIETNGTLKLDPNAFKYIAQVNCSPKLQNSGNDEETRLKPKILRYLSAAPASVYFKFVVSNETDWGEIEEDFIPHIKRSQVYIMPAGESIEQLQKTRLMAAYIAKKGLFKYSSRLHIDIWNQKTGV